MLHTGPAIQDVTRWRNQ